MKDFNKLTQIALGRIEADVVLKNAKIINVFTQDISYQDIAICDDIIAGIGTYNGKKEIDCSNLYASPGLIDSHVHIESSMITPYNFSKLVLERGITTVIADPHEITNVLGVKGLDYMLENSEDSLIDIYYMLPSCVPATQFEDSGAVFTAEDMKQFLDNKAVLGLGEVMDVPSLVNCDKTIVDKIQLMDNKILDGHCPGIDEKTLNAYKSFGISTDHECSCAKEAYMKIKAGMFVLIREGSAARNLKNLLPAVNDKNFKRFLFCTDDRHVDDLIKVGSIDFCIKKAVKEGMDPIRAVTIASINAAECYGLKNLGAIAPGYKADIILFNNLEDLKPVKIFKNGIEYTKQDFHVESKTLNSMNIHPVHNYDFKVKAKKDCLNIIKLIPHSLETTKVKRSCIIKDDFIDSVNSEDINKIAVLERHKNTGRKSVGFIEGYGLREAAIAQTIAHDSHNIVVIGDNDSDMVAAVNELINIGGGVVIVSKGKIVEELSLPIAGIMTSEEPLSVAEKIKSLEEYARLFGVKEDFDPFLTLAFMSLPVIPEIKITSQGIFDYKKFGFIYIDEN